MSISIDQTRRDWQVKQLEEQEAILKYNLYRWGYTDIQETRKKSIIDVEYTIKKASGEELKEEKHGISLRQRN